MRFQEDSTLLEDHKMARKLRMKATRYTLVRGELHNRGRTFPLQKCASKEEGAYILKEIHEGICGSHVRGRVLAYKAIRMGYLWPGMHADSLEMVQKGEKCQMFASVPSVPPEELTPISS